MSKAKPVEFVREPDYWRQLDLFDPSKFKTPVTVIGAGGRGSHLAWVLAKMGCRRITVYDPAEVTADGLRHEIYGPNDVGTPKVEALRRRIHDAMDITIRARNWRFESFDEAEGVVFMAVNDPEARRRIWEESIKFRFDVPLFVDLLAGAKTGAVVALNPMVALHCDRYDALLAKTNGARAPDAPVPSLDVLSGLAGFRLIELARGEDIKNSTALRLPQPEEQADATMLGLDMPITVIGVGAVGSYAVLQLAKQGYRDITAWDFDTVENHNLPNQLYGPQDVGLLKVEALRRRVLDATGIAIKAVPERFEGGELSGAILTFVDTMHGRRQIWEKSACGRTAVRLYVEARMGISHGIIYSVDPTNDRHRERYEKTLYADDQADESACSNRAIAPSVAALSGLSTLPFAQSNRRWQVCETIFQMTPWRSVENVW
jgi:predicted ThiF/HesA family dinucleotide-utilizing enzyme